MTRGLVIHSVSRISALGKERKNPSGNIAAIANYRRIINRNHERIANEAKALRLISTKTTIPVPKLLDYGVHSDGCQYLVTELIKGIRLDQVLDRGCSSPEGQKHTDSKVCEICITQAYSNAVQFIEDIVLPQLALLKSRERGLDGFVMPPSWLSPDVQPPWKRKQYYWKTFPLNEAKYIFQHGDIAAHNIIIDSHTLQVKALIDWEYAGFYLPGTERWPGTLDSDAYEQRSSQLAYAIEKFIPKEYLACYDQWEDKAELDELIEYGELPQPDRLRHSGEDELKNVD